MPRVAGSDLRRALRAVMQQGATTPLADVEFNQLALAAFEHQFEHNRPYRAYCERRSRSPERTTVWHEIPAVPTAAFKEVALVAGDPAAAPVVFRTSGTTRGAEQRGAHYLLDPGLYEASLLPTFAAYVLRGATRMRMLSLIASAEVQPDSSLSFMASAVVRAFGSGDSAFFAGADGLDTAALESALTTASDGQPACLLGTSLAFAHFMAAHDGTSYMLPPGSVLMDTGGVKGEHRTLDAAELRDRYRSFFGLPAESCINEYGMTELCSQCYDAIWLGGATIKRGPPWLRTRVVDPDTLAPVTRGRVGILQHFDLANLDSVCAIITEDLAYEAEDGFVLLGRAPGAPPRGCSIAMDILLADRGDTA